MEEQRRRAEKLQAQATTATQVKRDFLAFIGHECRNPLNALFNVTDFLMDTGYVVNYMCLLCIYRNIPDWMTNSHSMWV